MTLHRIALFCLLVWTGSCHLSLRSQEEQKELYSRVENAETEVTYNAPTDIVCLKRRTVTVLNEKGRAAANFYSTYNEKHSALRRFAGTVTDAAGNVLYKIKKSDLQRSEYSADLASDAFRYYYEYTPLQYPFCITYEWEEKYFDNIGLPMFLPQQGYNQSVVRASYRLLAPADIAIRCRAVCCEARIERQTTPEGKQLIQVEVGKLPALRNEPFAPDLHEVMPRIYFVPEQFVFGKTSGRMESWQSYGQWQYSLLEGRDQLPEALVTKLKELTASCQTDRERVQAVYDYLAATTRYVSIQLGIGGLQPMPASEVYRTGFGDCKALTNYTRAMLAALGIPSYYTVISTNNERFLPDFASANQANHVILQVPLPGDTLWLECTCPSLPLGYVHNSIAGHDALLISEKGGTLCRLPQYADSLHLLTSRAIVSLAADGKAQIDVRQQARLFQYEDRLGLLNAPANEQRDRLRSSLRLPQAEIGPVSYREQKASEPSIDLSYTVSSSRYGTRTGKRLFLPANIFHRSFRTPTDSTGRTQEFRIRYGYTDIDSIRIDLPEGYAVESMPVMKPLETPFGTFHAAIRAEGKSLHIVQRLYIRQGSYPKEQYARYLEFRSKVAAQYGAKIIICKTEEPSPEQ